MPRLSIWNSGLKGNDHNFINKIVSEFFGASAPAVYVWLYLGPQPDTAGTTASTIQDPLLLENRDRTYSTTPYELRGLFTESDIGFNLLQFGSFVSTDNRYVHFHLDDMVAACDRKLMAGDVLEFRNERDQYLLNGGPAIDSFYVIQDAAFASDGFQPTWFPYIWRTQAIPMTASQEYSDILNSPAFNPLGQPQTLAGTGSPGTPATIGDLMSTLATTLGLNQEVWDDAVAQVPERYFETQQFYIIPGTETSTNYPWIFAGDGIPPNGAALLGQGTSFPDSPSNNDYYLRTDFIPPTLFQFQGNAWVYQEADWRQPYNVAHRLLESFINDENIVTYDDGTTAPEKVALSQAVTVKADF
jgi:hypothetical protein